MRNLKNIEYFNEKNVTWIRLNRPEKLNALNEETWLELKESVIKANTEKTNLICITGNGRAFSAGDDIQSMYQFKDLSESKNFFNKLKDTIMAIVESEKPIMFAVNGLAYGGGCELLLLGDFVISVPDALFSLPESKLGLIPPLALSIGMFIMGLRNVARLALSGEPITASEALRIGLIDEIVEKDTINERAHEISNYLSKIPNTAISAIRKILAIHRANFISSTVDELAKISLTNEAKTKMKDFLEKRKFK